MGLLDEVTKLAGLTGDNLSGNSALLQGVLQMLTSDSGFAGLVQNFQLSGLGDLIASWISTGGNMPVSSDQLQQVLGGRIQQLAQGAGLPEGDVASALTELLPNVIDRLTPDGNMPQGGQLPQLLASLKSALGA